MIKALTFLVCGVAVVAVFAWLWKREKSRKRGTVEKADSRVEAPAVNEVAEGKQTAAVSVVGTREEVIPEAMGASETKELSPESSVLDGSLREKKAVEPETPTPEESSQEDVIEGGDSFAECVTRDVTPVPAVEVVEGTEATPAQPAVIERPLAATTGGKTVWVRPKRYKQVL
jgi:hypothetical protein